MPELPEVETMCRGVRGVEGGRIVEIGRTPCNRRPIKLTPRVDVIRRRIVGCRVVAVLRWGKKVVLHFDSDDRLVIEPRMTGLVLVDEPPTLEHLRFRIELTACSSTQLLFWDRRGLGTIYLLSAQQWDEQQQSGRLGPDALEISVQEFQQRLANSSREIKVALLDQAKVAGIGNLYASEILHLAGVHPQIPCHRINQRQWSRMHSAMREILNQAILYEGSTLADGTYRNALNQSGSYQNCHQVYDRAGEKCPRCQRGTIQRIIQAQRSTFFCGRCQKLPPT